LRQEKQILNSKEIDIYFLLKIFFNEILFLCKINAIAGSCLAGINATSEGDDNASIRDWCDRFDDFCSHGGHSTG
jgi:hypothetical protein